MKFSLVNLGCKVNRVESDSVAATLVSHGAILVQPKEADIIVINTCTVTGEAEKKTRKAVRRALKSNEYVVVVVTGCAVAINPEVFLAMDERIRVINRGELASKLEHIDYLNELVPNAKLSNQPRERKYENAQNRVGEGFPTRVGIKVQDGCDSACTYCIVHVARGKATSRTAEEVVCEAMALESAGVLEIVLTGINLGTYRCATLHLVDLLRSLLTKTKRARFRLSSIEPCDVSEGLIELMASSDGRICRHLHLPLQSGSSRVLREMARPYTADYFASLVDELYRRIPGISLSTDIIVGFPGETNEDFEETFSLAQRCRFAKIHAFPYSRREGTPAAARDDQIDPLTKQTRTKRLIELGEALRIRAYESRRHSSELVLIEVGGKGMSESYFEVPVLPEMEPGTLVCMKLP